MGIDGILGELARKSYQAKNGNNSYEPLVAKAKSELYELIQKCEPKKKDASNIDREDSTGNRDDDYENGVNNGEVWGHNQAISEYSQAIEKLFKEE